MAIVLALLAAGANAFATVLQRIGVEEAVRKDSSTRALMASVLRRPIWFAGLALTTASFLLQAIALSLGNLSTVQPVMVTEILFLVVILGLWFHKALGWREWIGAIGTSCGLGTFLALSAAHGGTERPAPEDWLLLLTASVGAVLVSLSAARHGSRSWRAACFGVAAAVAFALTAACIKSTTDQWSRGPVFIFTHVGTYGIAAAGLVGLVISQHALKAGPVAASQSALLIVNPIASIVMGVYLFGDRLQIKGGRFAVEVIALGVMFASLFVLSHSPLITSTSAGEDLSSHSTLQQDWGGLPT
jgi:drug/metabolite transporter (DMT)-like permease